MGLWKDRTRKDWRYSFQIRGKVYAGGGFKTRREAQAGREKRKSELKAIRPKQTGMDFLTVSNAYLDDVERRHVKSTYLCKRLVFRTFLERVGNPLWETITPQRINQHLLSLPSNCRFNVHRKELSSLWQWGIKVMGIQMTNPVLAVDKMPHTPKIKTMPSQEEVVRMVLAARPGDEQDILLTVLHTWARIDEVLRCRWIDVNFERRVITLWTRKRKGGQLEADYQPMNQDLFDLLMRRWKEREQDTWVFYNRRYKTRYMHQQKTMQRICERAGINPLGHSKRKIRGKIVDVNLYYGFHTLRHFMGSYHADKLKTPLSVISKMYRHKNKRTTEIYLHTMDESMRAAIAQQDGIFTPQNAKPQAAPASINENANDSNKD